MAHAQPDSREQLRQAKLAWARSARAVSEVLEKQARPEPETVAAAGIRLLVRRALCRR